MTLHTQCYSTLRLKRRMEWIYWLGTLTQTCVSGLLLCGMIRLQCQGQVETRTTKDLLNLYLDTRPSITSCRALQKLQHSIVSAVVGTEQKRGKMDCHWRWFVIQFCIGYCLQFLVWVHILKGSAAFIEGIWKTRSNSSWPRLCYLQSPKGT